MRKSSIVKLNDEAGEYEAEYFEHESPKSVIICSHGNGVRRWDGENFFHNVADKYQERAVYLVDQNQVIEGGCQLTDIRIMRARVQKLISYAKNKHPGIPIIVLAHSMGCGIASHLELGDVDKVIFVAPAAGNVLINLKKRYGDEIINTGGMVKTSDGLNKLVSKEYLDSVADITWEDEYKKLLNRFKSVYVFEAGDEEIVGEERFLHRNLGFKSYKVVEGATHNVHGRGLENLFSELDQLV